MVGVNFESENRARVDTSRGINVYRMDQELVAERKREGWPKGATRGVEFGWFWGVATGVVVAYPCGLPLSVPRGQGGLPPDDRNTAVRRVRVQRARTLPSRVRVYARTLTNPHLRLYLSIAQSYAGFTKVISTLLFPSSRETYPDCSIGVTARYHNCGHVG